MVMLIITVFTLNTGLAQKTYVGIKSGGHVRSAFIDHTIFNLNTKTNFEPGIHGGVFFKYLPKTRDTFLKSGLQFSVIYVQKGWKQIFPTDEPGFSVAMNYVEVPVEAIGYFGNKNNYFITAGFYLEYLLSHSSDPDPDPQNLGGQDVFSYEPARDNEVGYGGRLSAGIFRDFSFGMLHLEGFFTYSFSNFIDAGDLTAEIPDISNLWTTGLSLGYLIQLNKKQ
ncbi:MAG: hypothetical protein Tsb0034_09100 [Ekhidna sp.]